MLMDGNCTGAGLKFYRTSRSNFRTVRGEDPDEQRERANLITNMGMSLQRVTKLPYLTSVLWSLGHPSHALSLLRSPKKPLRLACFQYCILWCWTTKATFLEWELIVVMIKEAVHWQRRKECCEHTPPKRCSELQELVLHAITQQMDVTRTMWEPMFSFPLIF